MAKVLNGESGSNIDLFAPFSRAATLMKHRGFREEREVRIVAMPQRLKIFRFKAGFARVWPVLIG
jgi:hypothetical protein